MLLFLILMLLVLLRVINQPKISFNYSISFLLSILVMSFFVSELVFRNIPVFISDEILYSNVELETIFNNKDRMFWYFVNYFEKKYDLFGMFFLKLINIPILLLVISEMYNFFDKKKFFLWISFLLPYLNILAIRNFRDMFLILMWVSIFNGYANKNYIKLFLAGVTLYFLRPFLLIIILVLIMTHYLFFTVKRKSDGIYEQLNKILSLSLIIIISINIISLVTPRVEKYHSYYTYLFEQDGLEKSSGTRVIKYMNGDLKHDIPISMVRYILTPLPTSYFKKVLNESTGYGYNDDILKIIHQTIVLLLLAYILFNLKYFFHKKFRFTPYQKYFLISILLYFTIYAIYYFGTGHLRLKVPFHVLLFIVSYKIYSIKGCIFELRNYKFVLYKSRKKLHENTSYIT